MTAAGSTDAWGPVLGAGRRGNPFEETVERLLRVIRLGVVAPGDRLPAERELAARLGVSRQTLREALGSLRDEGWLSSRRGRSGGTFVLPPPAPAGTPQLDAVEVEDALALRFALETGAAELAARASLAPRQRAALSAAHDVCCDADLRGYRAADSRLHLVLAELAGAASLAAAVAEARARTNALLDRIPLLPRNIAHSDRQHERVVSAVLDGDPPRARAAMAEHLDGTAALLRAFLT